MANHAYVLPKSRTLPSAEEFDAFIRKLVEKLFPGFVVERDDTYWHVHHKTWDIDFFGSTFWFSEHNTYDENEEVIDTQPCVEFRHGHCGRLGWWLEQEIRSGVSYHLDALEVDDGYYKIYETKYKPGKTFFEHLQWIFRKREEDNKDLLIAFELHWIDSIMKSEEPLPDDLVKKLGIPHEEFAKGKEIMGRVNYST